MVKTRIGGHAQLNIDKLNEVILIFGKTLTWRKNTETVDAFGDLSGLTNADTIFTGDLQYGVYLDERLVKVGAVEFGDAVLYISPDALSTYPSHGDLIIDGDTGVVGTYKAWSVVTELENPKLEGTVVHKSFRCQRRDPITVT